MRRSWWYLSLACSLGLTLPSCCKRTNSSPPEESHPGPTAAASAVAVSPTASTPPPAPALEFSGDPDPSVKFLYYKPLRWNAVQFACPVGWSGCNEYYDGLVQQWSKDETARFTLHGIGGRTVNDKQIDLWTRNLGGKNVQYGPRRPTTFGKKGVRAEMAEGHGMLGKAPARFWMFGVDVTASEKMLVIAALKDDAPPERLLELTAALRSVYRAGG